MNLTFVRNATLILNYGGQRLLIDPYFADKHALPPYTGASHNPMVDLPLTPAAIMAGVEAVLVTHLHSDHFDPAAKAALPKDWPVYCQPGNDDAIREVGFTTVTPISDTVTWGGITITRTGGHHGLGGVEQVMGPVSGFVFAAPGEPTVYLAGDTVLCAEVREALSTHQPDVIITNSGGAMWDDPANAGQRVYILMEAAETIETAQLAPHSRLIAIHLEALDHCTVSRADLRATAEAAGIPAERLLIPADGATLAF